MMRRPCRVDFTLLLAIGLFAPVVPLTSHAQEATPAVETQIVAEGITNPRGFTWGADGTMYLAVSGSGGENPGPEGSPFSGGDTASVVTVQDGVVTTLADGLPSSVWRDLDWVWGAMDVAILGDQLYALVGGGGAIHGNPDTPSGVYRVNADGTTALVADLGAWVDENPVATAPPEGAPNNGSFFAMVPVGDALWVTDAVNAQILAVTLTGAVSRIADFSAGQPGPTPTGLAADPNGGAWVGYLTVPPYPAGASKISHVAPDGTIEDVWTGLQAVTGIALGPDGVLYAAEIGPGMSDEGPLFERNAGRIVRQTGLDSAEVVAAGLDLPVAIRFGPDGAIYVSSPAYGSDDGSGQVLRLETATAAPVGTGSQATPVG